MMNNNRQLAQNAQVRLPTSVVRTISLEKLSQLSPLAEHQNNHQTNKPSENEQQKSKKMYEKLLGRKLNGKAEPGTAKQNKELDIRHVMSKKFEELRKEVVSNEMKECTFKPQVNPSQKQTRNVDEFFKDQYEHIQKKNDKIQEMRILLENTRQKENIFRPNAMLTREKKSHQESQQVYQRLYQDSKNKDQNEQMSRKGSRDTLRTNSITSSKRFRGISTRNSAEKNNRQSEPVTCRQLKKNGSTAQHNISSELSAITSRKGSTELDKGRKQSKLKEISKRVDVNIWEKKDNNKTQQFVIGKLMKEIIIVLEKCQLPLVFSYMEMNFFLQKMNFVTSNNSSRKQLFEIWNMLQGEIYQEVSALSVMKIVYAIMGCHNVSLVNKCLEQTWLKQNAAQLDRKLKTQGKQLSFRQNLLMLTERDSKTLKQCYEQLYSNRMKMGQSDLLKEEKPAEYTFKPAISKNTNEFAERYRNRMLCETEKLLNEQKISYPVPQTGEIDHVDLLMLDQKRKQASIQQKRQLYEQERRRKEDEALSSGVQRQSNRSSRNNNRDRNHELYEMGRNANQNKRDRSTDQVEEEKWKKDLTFKPSIKAKKNILQQLSSKQTYIPDYDKTIYRMQQARKSKDTTPRRQEKDDSPLLYLNVVMDGSQSVKVPVYRGENMRSITEKVGKMMELDNEEGRNKLEQILKMQILPALEGLDQNGIAVE